MSAIVRSRCSCGSCTLLHYVPVPKTASEATKTHLGSRQSAVGSPCINCTFCFAQPGTHEMNTRLPPLDSWQPLVSSPEWWRVVHGSCTVRSAAASYRLLPHTARPPPLVGLDRWDSNVSTARSIEEPQTSLATPVARFHLMP